MRINEAYEHEPILPYPGEESCPCGRCSRTGNQCVEIAAPLTFTPGTTIGAAVISCQGEPVVTCETAADGSTCTVTVTQLVNVSVPIQYHVTVDGETCPTIRCADDACKD